MSRGTPWLRSELQLLRDIYPDVPCGDVAALLARPVGSVYQAAAKLRLKKSAAFKASDFSGRVQRGKQCPSMTASHFKPGHTPWNSGLKGWTAPGTEATRFKPGIKPHNTLPVGSYRVNKDGHLQRKISEAKGSNSKRWRGVAELVWVATHGPLPRKHMVVFKPGQFTSTLDEITLARIECISMADNARRNHPRNKSPELARLVQLKGAITRQVNRITREAEQAKEQHA